ncbi:serine/threonine protein kinase [Proteus mirabilis]|nr:serine/threonine protein kinase [Proteus mirabilis]
MVMMDEKFRSYTIRRLGELGSGGFGRVEKVEIINKFGESKGYCARKVLLPEACRYDEVKRRFIREVISQSKCTHKNVVPVYMCNLQIDTPWFIMDLAENDLFKDIKDGTLPSSEKLRIINMILNGVGYIHKRGYLHRDIKPQNILKIAHFDSSVMDSYKENGDYKISDFGLVKNTNPENDSTQLTRIGAGEMGTQYFSAPEAWHLGDFTVQSDIYSIGKVIQLLDVGIPGIEQIVGRCLEWDKYDRYDSVESLKNDLINLDREGQ